MFKRGCASSLILALLLLTGCGASNSGLPPAPKKVSMPAKNIAYKLGPLDQIEVFVWRAPELSSSVTIRPDGKVSLPLIPDLQAAGKTPDALSQELTDRLKKYMRDPIVTVLVRNFSGSFDQQVRIIGQTRNPGALPYRAGMTVLDVIIGMGGLREDADGNAAVLVRRENGRKLSYALQLDDLVRRGNIGANPPVLPGDVIIIPELRF